MTLTYPEWLTPLSYIINGLLFAFVAYHLITLALDWRNKKDYERIVEEANALYLLLMAAFYCQSRGPLSQEELAVVMGHHLPVRLRAMSVALFKEEQEVTLQLRTNPEKVQDERNQPQPGE